MADEGFSAASESKTERSSRLPSVDGLRGLIIILMALDHANHFVAQKHSSGEFWGGPFPSYDDPITFLTRLVTHLAAPGFFFLMGLGMILFTDSRRKQGWTESAVTRHFLIRGALLIALQLLVVNRAWELSPGGWVVETYIGVLVALGGTMMLAAPLIRVNPKNLLFLSAVLLIGTELLAPNASLWGKLESNSIFDILNLALIYPGGTRAIWSNYPLLPWLELVLFGMVFGNWLLTNPRQAYWRALILGVIFLAAFLVIRSLDGFGNIRPRQGSGWIDYLNVVKYPPSIAFTLMTMSANLVLLGLLGLLAQESWRYLRPVVTFGQVPLFFYASHLFLYAVLGLWLTPHGTSIPQMYPYWLLGLVLLYPLCRLYAQWKQHRANNIVLRFL